MFFVFVRHGFRAKMILPSVGWLHPLGEWCVTEEKMVEKCKFCGWYKILCNISGTMCGYNFLVYRYMLPNQIIQRRYAKVKNAMDYIGIIG